MKTLTFDELTPEQEEYALSYFEDDSSLSNKWGDFIYQFGITSIADINIDKIDIQYSQGGYYLTGHRNKDSNLNQIELEYSFTEDFALNALFNTPGIKYKKLIKQAIIENGIEDKYNNGFYDLVDVPELRPFYAYVDNILLNKLSDKISEEVDNLKCEVLDDFARYLNALEQNAYEDAYNAKYVVNENGFIEEILY